MHMRQMLLAKRTDLQTPHEQIGRQQQQQRRRRQQLNGVGFQQLAPLKNNGNAAGAAPPLARSLRQLEAMAFKRGN
ncbi:unnamed protein product [Lampetra fluviatilis]